MKRQWLTLRKSWFISEKICCIKESCRKPLPCAKVDSSERTFAASRSHVANAYLAQKLIHQREYLLHQSVLLQIVRRFAVSRSLVANTYLAQKLIHQREDLLHQSVLAQIVVAFDQHFVLFTVAAQTVDDLGQINAPRSFITRFEILDRGEIWGRNRNGKRDINGDRNETDGKRENLFFCFFFYLRRCTFHSYWSAKMR